MPDATNNPLLQRITDSKPENLDKTAELYASRHVRATVEPGPDTMFAANPKIVVATQLALLSPEQRIAYSQERRLQKADKQHSRSVRQYFKNQDREDSRKFWYAISSSVVLILGGVVLSVVIHRATQAFSAGLADCSASVPDVGWWIPGATGVLLGVAGIAAVYIGRKPDMSGISDLAKLSLPT